MVCSCTNLPLIEAFRHKNVDSGSDLGSLNQTEAFRDMFSLIFHVKQDIEGLSSFSVMNRMCKTTLKVDFDDMITYQFSRGNLIQFAYTFFFLFLIEISRDLHSIISTPTIIVRSLCFQSAA